jgi:hypothetical protein
MSLSPVAAAWDGSAINVRGWPKVIVWCTVAPSVAPAPQGSPDGAAAYATQSVTKNVAGGVSTVAAIDAIGLYTLPGNQFLRLNGGTGGTFFIAGANS